ncbi:PAS domain S-box protein [Poseidonocella sedimentorum]|uniref:Sensor protein FixL n=1 Tax=Poseidonocella sedimentorum TaxID=871652 RepID=A0A1I6DVT0_9RHOB|nr:PAS domain S-box protein [Poseidonocella sedimentorum]SFR09477.1 PAS domain S-box-containing protein [Poseidonocella sedimentorum]
MKDKLHDSALLSAILEAAVDAMIVAEADGTILRANPAASAMFGRDQAEMVGQRVNMLMPAAMAAQHDGFMRHHIETGEKRIIGLGRDVEGLRADGTVFPLHLSVGRAEIDGLQLFIGILHDLTERRATQEALARTQRLDAIGQLTGGIAHDFNNLLTVIIGNLELLEMRGADERQLRLIRDSLESAELGADLTSRLLVFARKGQLKPVRADLRALCEETLALLQRSIGETYGIRTEFPPGPAEVEIDPVQLQSALINLAINARDAMPGGGELVISIAPISIEDSYMAQETDIARGDYIRLSIRDSGTGMSPEAQRRAFEPFFTTKSETGGTGLGLAMVYGFVRQSGGYITLYSEPGHGTSFGLYFPALHHTDGAGTGAEAPGATAARGRGQTVLVVEDNPRVRRLSIERVTDLGYRTLEAESGDAAYAMIKRGVAVDAVFTDLVMPGALNGYDLARKLREEHPGIRVLLTSGYANDVVTGQFDASSDLEVLNKPYRQAELAERLQALFAERP